MLKPAGFLMIAVLCLPSIHSSFAQDMDSSRKSLEGLKSVDVRILVTDERPRVAGPASDKLRKQVEQKLRDGGIHVDSEAIEYFVVSVELKPIPTVSGNYVGFFGYVKILLTQPVRLLRDPIAIDGITWSAGQFVLGPGEASEPAAAAVDDLIRMFVEDYASVN